MDYGKCSLPGGYIDEAGQLHKEVSLVPLSGREEELLVSMSGQGAAAQVSTILSCCVKHIGSISDVSKDLMQKLLVGDRQYLMLKLREITFGEKVQASVSCPWPECDTGVDVNFRIPDIPIKDAQLTTLIHECEFSVGSEDARQKVWFRLPNGADQEALSKKFHENNAIAATQLLWRCIQRIDEIKSPTIEQVRDLSSNVRQQIEQRMQKLAPDVELTMQAQCPECHRDFSIPFDIQEFFFGELKTSRELLRREVHYLAYHYHWSEQDILSMTRDKRHEYIDVLTEEIDRLNSGVQSSAVS